jgi:DNA modification methylase
LPEALLERIIRLSSNKGDVVFDPFVGSGTTLAVAARLKRRWVGCELSKDYAKRATQRIEHAQRTGQTQFTTLEERGVDREKPKKRREPHRSPHLRRRSRTADPQIETKPLLDPVDSEANS